MTGMAKGPTRPFRVIRGDGGNQKTVYFRTREARDASAQRFADWDRSTVVTELWDESHPQDSLNLGWACDGTVKPR
jgi:hypothetical protein